MLRPAGNQLQNRLYGIFRIIKPPGPERTADGNRILGVKLFLAEHRITEALPHPSKQLLTHPFYALLIENADPGGRRTSDRGKPDQIMLLNDGKQMQESLRPSGIHSLTDCLSGAFLESCRQKESAKDIIEFPASAHHNSADQLMADHNGISFSKENLLHRLYCPFTAPVNLCGKHFPISEILIPGMVEVFWRHLSGQQIRQAYVVKI